MKKAKKTQMNILISDKARGQLAELQRILSARIGTEFSQGRAIEVAIDRCLDILISEGKGQANLFG